MNAQNLKIKMIPEYIDRKLVSVEIDGYKIPIKSEFDSTKFEGNFMSFLWQVAEFVDFKEIFEGDSVSTEKWKISELTDFIESLSFNQKILLLTLCEKNDNIDRVELILKLNDYIDYFNRDKNEKDKLDEVTSNLLSGASAGINNRKDIRHKEKIFTINKNENTYSINKNYSSKIKKILFTWGFHK